MVAALIEAGERILVQQRAPGVPRGLLWEFPGGKVEAGEADALALARECREELGCEVAVGELVAQVEHSYPDLRLVLALYRCRVTSGAPTRLEAHAVRWVARCELGELRFCEADQPLVARLLEERAG